MTNMIKTTKTKIYHNEATLLILVFLSFVFFFSYVVICCMYSFSLFPCISPMSWGVQAVVITLMIEVVRVKQASKRLGFLFFQSVQLAMKR